MVVDLVSRTGAAGVHAAEAMGDMEGGATKGWAGASGRTRRKMLDSMELGNMVLRMHMVLVESDQTGSGKRETARLSLTKMKGGIPQSVGSAMLVGEDA